MTTAYHIQTTRMHTARGALTIETRQPVADRGMLLNTHPTSFWAVVTVAANGQPFQVEISLPFPTIQDVVENAEEYLAEQLPIQAPGQIKAQIDRARGQQPVIQVPAR